MTRRVSGDDMESIRTACPLLKVDGSVAEKHFCKCLSCKLN